MNWFDNNFFELFKKLAPRYQPTASFKNATLLLQMKLKENNLDLFNFRKSTSNKIIVLII